MRLRKFSPPSLPARYKCHKTHWISSLFKLCTNEINLGGMAISKISSRNNMTRFVHVLKVFNLQVAKLESGCINKRKIFYRGIIRNIFKNNLKFVNFAKTYHSYNILSFFKNKRYFPEKNWKILV